MSMFVSNFFIRVHHTLFSIIQHPNQKSISKTKESTSQVGSQDTNFGLDIDDEIYAYPSHFHTHSHLPLHIDSILNCEAVWSFKIVFSLINDLPVGKLLWLAAISGIVWNACQNRQKGCDQWITVTYYGGLLQAHRKNLPYRLPSLIQKGEKCVLKREEKRLDKEIQ